MPEAVPAAARDLPLAGYGGNTAANASATPSPTSLTDAALLALKLAPDIILGAHLSGLKPGDTFNGHVLPGQPDQPTLLVSERGVFAVSPKENLPASGSLNVRVTTVGRTLTVVVPEAPVRQTLTLTLISLPPETRALEAPVIATPEQAHDLAKFLAKDFPALASALRILPEQSERLSRPVAPVAAPVAPPSSAALGAPATLVTLVQADDPSVPPLAATILAVVEEENAALLHTGPLAQLLSQSRAAILRPLPTLPGSTVVIAELVQSGKPPLRVVLPEALKQVMKNQSLVVMLRPQDAPYELTEKIDTILDRLPADAAPFVRERLPAVGSKLAGQIALLTHTARQEAHPDVPLPSKNRAAILEAVASFRSAEAIADGGNKLTLPLRLFNEYVALHFTLYPPDVQHQLERGAAPHSSADHLFDVEVTFPDIGNVQLSGIYHGAHLSLTVSTESGLGDALQAELSDAYAKALEQDDWSGTIRFKSKTT